jgi:hypothetical protein
MSKVGEEARMSANILYVIERLDTQGRRILFETHPYASLQPALEHVGRCLKLGLPKEAGYGYRIYSMPGAEAQRLVKLPREMQPQATIPDGAHLVYFSAAETRPAPGPETPGF